MLKQICLRGGVFIAGYGKIANVHTIGIAKHLILLILY